MWLRNSAVFQPGFSPTCSCQTTRASLLPSQLDIPENRLPHEHHMHTPRGDYSGHDRLNRSTNFDAFSHLKIRQDPSGTICLLDVRQSTQSIEIWSPDTSTRLHPCALFCYRPGIFAVASFAAGLLSGWCPPPGPALMAVLLAQGRDEFLASTGEWRATAALVTFSSCVLRMGLMLLENGASVGPMPEVMKISFRSKCCLVFILLNVTKSDRLSAGMPVARFQSPDSCPPLS